MSHWLRIQVLCVSLSLSFMPELKAKEVEKGYSAQHISRFIKLLPKYTVALGDENAPVHCTEYFSIQCPRCLQTIREHFPALKERYIDTGKVRWTFHPDPSDLPTVQLMLCLSTLTPAEKWQLLVRVAEISPQMFSEVSREIVAFMEEIGKPMPEIENMHVVNESEALLAAYRYKQQPGIPTQVPTIEVNGVIHDLFPDLETVSALIERQLNG